MQIMHESVKSSLVSLVILTYNSEKDIERCLDSVKSLVYPSLEVIVVDNASCDETVNLIERKYNSARLIKSNKNIGFAAGINLGIAQAKGDFILLLNPDTEIDPFCVSQLVRVINTDSKIAVCGAKILLFDSRHIIQHAGGLYSLIGVSVDKGMFEQDKGQYNRIEEVTFACGACMLIRRSTISQIGLLDSSFFIYHEDVDFCIRAWFCGNKTVFVPDALVYHKSGYLTEIDQNSSNPVIVFHKHKNTLIILLKNFPILSIIFWFPLSIFYKMIWVLYFSFKKDWKSSLSIIKSVLWVINNFPKIFKDRQVTLLLKKTDDRSLKKLFVSPIVALEVYRKISNSGLALKKDVN
jgi:GT2 family glycosyltransferase